MSVAELEPTAAERAGAHDLPSEPGRDDSGSRRGFVDRAHLLPLELVVFAVALAARLTVLLRDGGLRGSNGYDAGVYFTAGDALIHGRVPYRDFVFLHPPGLPLALSPFALLTKVMSDESAFTVANLAFSVLGAVNAVLVMRVGRRLGLGRAAALIGALFYATWFGAVGAEYLTKLEPLGNFVFLCAVLAALRAQQGGSRWMSVLAGFGLGYLVSIKIWWIVPALGVLAWHAIAMRRVRTVWQVVAGFGLAGLVVDLPFFLLAPHTMFASVIQDQLGRARAHGTVAGRIGDLTTVSRLTGHLSHAALVAGSVGLCAVFVLVIVRAWVGRFARPAVVLVLAQLAVILAAPSWFHYYCDYLAVALALVVGGAAALPGRSTTAARRIVDWLPTVAVATVTALILGLGAAVLRPFHGAAQLTRAAAAERCVMTDSPIAQIELNALSRGLANGCRNWVDVTGLTYGPDRGQYPGQPRVDNARWQRDLLRYLRSGDAVILVRAGTRGHPPRRCAGSGGWAHRLSRRALIRSARPTREFGWAVPGAGVPRMDRRALRPDRVDQSVVRRTGAAGVLADLSGHLRTGRCRPHPARRGAVVVATVGAARLAPTGRRYLRVGYHASVALVLAADLFIGQVPYLVGVAFGVWALHALRTRHGVVAAVLAAASSLASPLAGAFIRLAGPALVDAVGWRRAAAVVAFAVPNPIGGNLARFGQLIALPLCWHVLPRLRWAGARPARWRCCSSRWQRSGRFGRRSLRSDEVRGTRRARARSTAASAASSARRTRRPDGSKSCSPREHWESVWVAKAFPIARGWERQTDLRVNAVLYHPISAAAYRRWHDDNAVSLVALPRVPIDFGGAAESDLLRHPPAYLVPMWHDANWRVWRVRGAHRLVSGPATIRHVGAASFVLDFRHSGTATIRIRGNGMWAATRGEGCVSRTAGGSIGSVLLDRSLRPAAPVVDAVVVGSEAVVHAPEHSLGAAGDVDLAVDGADVGLDGIGAEEGQRRDVGVALALGDQSQDLGLAIGQSLVPAGPVQTHGGASAAWWVADDGLAGVNGFERRDELTGRQGLGQVAMRSLPAGVLDEVGMEVPGVDDDAVGVRAVDEDLDLAAVGFGLGERVVERDVDGVVERLVGVDLGNEDTIAIRAQHAGDAGQHDVVVVDQSDQDRLGFGRHDPTINLPRGVLHQP